jgi:hypothetical protein
MSVPSPKDSPFGNDSLLPFQLIDALTTSKWCWKALLKHDNKVFFSKFDHNWDLGRELRVFVCNRKVTTISQYDFRNNGYFSTQTNQRLEQIGKDVTRFVEKLPIFHLRNFTADVYVNSGIRLIEINSFGYWLAAGSCLFHWIQDYDQLYGKTAEVEFRITR